MREHSLIIPKEPAMHSAQEAEFDRIACSVISYIKEQHKPVQLSEIEEHFSQDRTAIAVGRVILQLLADRKLYLTDDRKIKVTSRPMAFA